MGAPKNLGVSTVRGHKWLGKSHSKSAFSTEAINNAKAKNTRDMKKDCNEQNLKREFTPSV